MKKKQRKKAICLGVLFLAMALLCNKWLIELTIVSDGEIESAFLTMAIIFFQILAIIVGIYMLVTQPVLSIPSIRAPSGTEVILVISSVIFALGLTELGSRTWLNYFATPEQYHQYVLFNDLPPRTSPPSKLDLGHLTCPGKLYQA